MAIQDNTYYSCEGMLLVPTVHDRLSRWRERLVSGSRIVIAIGIVGLGTKDERFLLFGENCRQEKLFEVNLAYVKAYFFRTKTWHEITASDNRRFALSFENSERFARFYEQLERVLRYVNKLTTTNASPEDKADGAGNIVVLRVDKIPPPKPPRTFQNHSENECQADQEWHLTQGSADHHLKDSDGYSLIQIDGSESTTNVDASGERTTVWYMRIYDELPESNPIHNDPNKYEESDTYDHIPDDTFGHQLTNDHRQNNDDNMLKENETYKNIIDAAYTRPNKTKLITKPCEGNTCVDGSNYYDDDAYDNSRCTAPKPNVISTYNEVFEYDNVRDVQATQSTTTEPYLRARDLFPNSTETKLVACNARIGTPLPDIPAGKPVPKPKPIPRKRREHEEVPLQREEKWTCSRCTLINSSATDRCIACDRTRYGPRSETDTAADLRRLPSSYLVSSDLLSSLTSDKEWHCSACSARNRSVSTTCSTCSAWVCGHCTLHNNPDHWICVACTHSRLNV